MKELVQCERYNRCDKRECKHIVPHFKVSGCDDKCVEFNAKCKKIPRLKAELLK